MNTLLTAKDQILQYAAGHRIVVYVAAAVAILIVIALIRLVTARRQEDLSFTSSLTSPASAAVTPINEAPATRCTHCGISLSSRLDFCPACGYAQPMKQTGTAKSRS